MKVPLRLLRYKLSVEGRLCMSACSRPIRAVHQQNIQPAIAVIIEKRAARAEGFRKILGSESAVVVMEADAGLGGDVGQSETRIRGGRRQVPPAERAQNKRPAGHAMLTRPVRIA